MAEAVEMNDYEIADVTIDQVRPLLTASALPTDDLDPAKVELLGMRDQRLGSVIACVGLERYGKEALIRSLVVDSDHRGSGYGARLVDAVLHRAKAGASTLVFGVTTDADAYLSRFGFEPIEREVLTGAITTSTQLRGACPDTAIVMRKEL
jgi:amino-acid N-acetyltransferase